MGAEYNLRGGGSVSEGGSRGVVCPRLDQLRHLRVHAREAKVRKNKKRGVSFLFFNNIYVNCCFQKRDLLMVDT